MLLLEPKKLSNGAKLFPDDRDPEQSYFESGSEINVSKFAFKKGEGAPHQFVCEVNFALNEREKELHASLFKTGKTTLIPWESAKVKIWSVSEEGTRLLSEGITSGYGLHNSVQRAAPDFLPGEIYLSTELACRCSSNASVNKFEWNVGAEELFPQLIAETTRMAHSALAEGEVFTPHIIALRVIDDVRKKKLLTLEVTGAGEKWLDHQLMIQLASAWVDIAYAGGCECWEPAPPGLQAKCLEPTIPSLKKIISSPLKYRHPILFKLGKVTGN